MQLTTNSPSEKGFIEIILIFLLSLILIQIDALWSTSTLNIKEEQISMTSLKSHTQEAEDLSNKFSMNPTLQNNSILSYTSKSELISPNNKHILAVSKNLNILNWLYLDSLPKSDLPCDNTQNDPSQPCLINNYTLETSTIALFQHTTLSNLKLGPKSLNSFIHTSGGLNITNLNISISGNQAPAYVIISSYDKLKISKIIGSTPKNTIILIYSIRAPIEIEDQGLIPTCNQQQEGLVFIAPLLIIAGQNREDLILSSNTCLKHFPKKLFTSIKLAAIQQTN
jgi:hypothetical protein